MMKLFFLKNQIIPFSIQSQLYFKASNNLDSHQYAIQKIPLKKTQSQNQYINNHYFEKHHDNIITYYNCWTQKQQLLVEKEKEKPIKKQKKKMMEVLKKKSKIQNQHFIAPSKNVIMDEQIVYQDYLFVQLQSFSPIQLPKDFLNLKEFIVMIYLLAKKVQKESGFLPCLIPVWGNDSIKKYKFLKKGKTINLQLCNLMEYAFKQNQQEYLKQWSQSMWKSIMKAKINKDAQLVGQIIKNEIQQFLTKPHQIIFKLQNKMTDLQQECYINNYDVIKLGNCNIQIPIYEYDIQYLHKSQMNRQITLIHNIYESYVFSGKKDWFIVKWLKNMSN